MSRFSECYLYQEAGEKKFGRVEWHHTMKQRNREKLERGGADRPKRKPLSPSQRKNLYVKQGGRCALCDEPKGFGELSDDHFDPTAEDFNNIKNRRLVCRGCNSQKGANGIMQEAKRLGVGVKDMISKQDELHGSAYENYV